MKIVISLICIMVAFAMILCDSNKIWSQVPSGNGRMPIPEELKQKIDQLHFLMRGKNGNSIEVSKAMELDRQSREVARSGDFETADRLIVEAISMLKGVQDKESTGLNVNKQEAATIQRTDNRKFIELQVNSDKVILTKTVPDFKNGKDVGTLKDAFPAYVVKAVDGKVNIEISSVPVIVEENEREGSDGKAFFSKSVSLDSPFGGTPIPVPAFDKRYSDIGVKWIRYSGITMAWDFVERTRGVYDWSRCDSLFSETSKNDINSLITVRSFNQWDQPTQQIKMGKLLKPKAPRDMASFLKFLAKAVERYTGEGTGDTTGSTVVTYWQIENEIDGNFWGDSPENYARLLKASCQTIKKTNPVAKVVIAGASDVEGFNRFFIPVLKELRRIEDKPGERYFDVFDFHWYGNAGEYKNIHGNDLQVFIEMCNKTLSNYGYSNVPLWITETGTYGGRGVVGKRGEPLPEQDEAVQASELVKRYVYFIGCGIKKIFWSHLVEEHHRDGFGTFNDYFENVGLINNPRNLGDSSNKMAYYSYKLLIEKLEGSSWENTYRVDLGTGVYAYCFLKNGKNIFVIWSDKSW